MQTCTNCGFQNPSGEVFCRQCGVALTAVSVSTAQLGENTEATLAAGSEHLSSDHIVFLHFAGYDDPIGLQVDKPVTIGRENGDGFLNVDQFDALDQGVSRRHAMLRPEGSRLYIEDLESTNKTYLNGDQLMAGREYAIRDGDEVALGRLVFKIFFK